MKFGKEFKKHMVPEWTEAYMDYNGLKRLLQDIRHFKQSKQPSTPIRALEEKLAMNGPFNGLNLHNNSDRIQGDIEDQVISVNTMQKNNSRKVYNTKFLMSSEEGGEKEATFFKKLDGELNKVNKFYKDKVDEVLNETIKLNKQMEALLALRIKVENPDFDSSSVKRLSMDIESTPLTMNSPSIPQSQEMGLLNVTRCDEPSNAFYGDEFVGSPSVVENFDLTHGIDTNYSFQNEKKACDDRPDPFEVLEHVKINNTLENPISTLKGVLADSRDKELRFKKEELREVEERLKLVFVQFYQKLRLLKHYSFTNLSAFAKIMKKYEKITTRSASRLYMKIVDNSFLGSSDEVTGLMERAEATYIKHFSNCNRREGMKLLRPKQKREKHSVTFFSGFFSGCSIALLVAAVLLIESKKILDKKENTLFMENIFPLYSFYACVVLHMLLYAVNTYFWKRHRINYPFIFGYKQGTELAYREVFLLSTGLTVLVFATFLAHLHLKLVFSETRNAQYVELVPLVLVIVILVMIVCPFNILYRSSRYFLIYITFRCLCAPLYQVTLPDFFLADQLTSQIQAIRSFEFYMCYYGSGEFLLRRNKCHSHDNVYNVFYFIVAVIPYWFRFLQCLRRLVEEKDATQGYNGLRYLLTVVAVVIRTAFEFKKNTTWKVLAVIFSALATIFNTYWDIVMDWGLLQRHSRNFLLRDKLAVKNKSVYFIAMILDILLRFAWLQLMIKFNIHSLHGKAVSSIFSFLEILRRGMWNFFRLENEHLNNVGKYRAFKSVPLPFNYDDDEENEKDD